MPLFYFNVHDGVSIPDEEGTELPNVGTARDQAVRLAGSLLREQVNTSWDDGEWHMDVCEGTGLILFRLTVFVTNAPIVGSLRHD